MPAESPSFPRRPGFDISAFQSEFDLDAAKDILVTYGELSDPPLPVPELSNLPGDYAPPKGALLIARSLVDSSPLGIIAYKHTQYIPPETCEMNRLFVNPSARGLGVGQALVNELIRTARDAGYEEMRLGVFESNASAVKLYEGCGFEKIERYKPKLYEGIQAYSLSLKG